MRICSPAEHERELHDFDDDQMVKVLGRSHSAMSTHNDHIQRVRGSASAGIIG